MSLREAPRLVTPLMGTGSQRQMVCRHCSGLASDAQLLTPTSLASGPDGSVYVGDFNLLRRITPDGMVYTLLQLRYVCCVRVCVCVKANSRAYIPTDTPASAYVHPHTLLRAYGRVYTGASTLVHFHLRSAVNTHLCTHSLTYIPAHASIYRHTHMRSIYASRITHAYTHLYTYLKERTQNFLTNSHAK